MVLALAMMIPAFWKMRPGGSLHTLAFPEVEPPRDVGDRVVVNPLEVGIPSARCLDGSWPSYYHRRPGGPTGANSWLLHFEGGGWCRPNAAGEGDVGVSQTPTSGRNAGRRHDVRRWDEARAPVWMCGCACAVPLRYEPELRAM